MLRQDRVEVSAYNMAVQRPISFTATARQETRVRRPPGWLVVLPALGALIAGILLYQQPTRTTIAIGSPGDQLFLNSSEALDAAADTAGSWYADELGGDGRSRWTRGRARLVFPGIGGGDAAITLRVQGWPADVLHGTLRQPDVTVSVGAVPESPPIETFTPSPAWQDYRFTIPSAARISTDLVIQLTASDTFTRTRQFSDPRPKGIRVDRVTVELAPPPGLARTGWSVVLQMAGVALIGSLAARRRSRLGLATCFGAGLAVASAALLLLWRAWAAAIMPALLLVALLAVLVVEYPGLRRLAGGAADRLRRGQALATASIGGLVGVTLFLVASVVRNTAAPGLAQAVANPDRLARVLPSLVVGGLLILAGPTVMPNVLRSLRGRLLVGRLAPLLLAAAGAIILLWELQLLRTVPIVGHADYADNAVVARALLRGQGWTVPYVTQFYRLVPGGSVFRPQETWPLLQPLWMAPWMALFGPTAFAARLSNLVFNAALYLLVYRIGATFWDRRVGLLAAVLTLLNNFFFRLTVYSTTDLGFTVLSMLALWLFYLAWAASTTPASGHVANKALGRFAPGIRAWARRPAARWAAAGIATGLMTLQKPTGAIFAVGMGLWALIQWWRGRKGAVVGHAIGKTLPWRGLLLWAGLTGLVLMPYFARNVLLFGQPIFSTEGYDAWILGYKGTRGEAWEEIYRLYLGDIPNRSWLLRWGMDRVIGKLLTQVYAIQKYFLPPTAGLLGTDPAKKYEGIWLGIHLSSTAPTWLALLGIFTLRGRRRGLAGLIAIAAVLYTVFLVTYWHADEERYFVPFIPWLLLIGMGGLCAAFDRILRYHGGRWAGLAGGFAMLLLWSTLQPQLARIDTFLDPRSGDYWGRDWLPDLNAYEWLRTHTRPGEVVMTRVPWQLSFEADRPSLMIPNAPLTSDDPSTPTIMQIARYYHAAYLVVNAMNSPGPLAQEGLRPLNQGQEILGFRRIYTGAAMLGRNPIYIYRFPVDYAGARPLR